MTDRSGELAALTVRFQGRVEAERDPAERARIQARWAAASRRLGRAGPAVTLCEQALRELGEELPKRSRFGLGLLGAGRATTAPAARPVAGLEAARLEAASLVLAELAAALCEEGDEERAARASDHAVSLAARLGEGPAFAAAAGRCAVAAAERGEAARAAELLAALERLDAAPGAAIARGFAARVHLELGRLPEARAAADDARRLAAGDDAGARLVAALSSAAVATFSGDVDAGLGLAEEAAALAAERGEDEARAEAAALTGFFEVLSGDAERGLRRLDEAGLRTGDGGASLSGELATRARLLVDDGQARERMAAAPSSRSARAASRHIVMPLVLEADALLRSALARGDASPPLGEAMRRLDRATERLERALRLAAGAPALELEARRLASVAAAERGDADAAARLRQVAADARALGADLLRVQALLDVATYAARLERRDGARELEEAASLARSRGMGLLAARADARREPRGAPRRARDLEVRQLGSLVEVGRALSSILELEPLLERIMDEVVALLGADRGFIMLYDRPGGALEFRVARNLDRERLFGPDLQISHTAVGRVEESGEPLVVVDARRDPRLHSQLSVMDLKLRSILCYPLRTPRGVLGVLYADSREVLEFLEAGDSDLALPFVAQAAVAIENASAYARIRELYEETLSVARAREKILDHLSHELRTPIALVRGTLAMVKKRVASEGGSLVDACALADRQLGRLVDLQSTIADIYGHEEMPAERIALGPLLDELAASARQASQERELELCVSADLDLEVEEPLRVLGLSLVSLIQNAVENTPDEGRIELSARRLGDGRIEVAVADSGVGITERSQGHLFDGFFHTQDTSAYSSRQPYAFDAGGKGLDLLRVKTFAERFGWELRFESRRCRVIPNESDVCPGRISRCGACQAREDCFASGGTTFRLALRPA